MQRIWITGDSGSGKTTLARLLGEQYGIPVYHRDSISWAKDDYERTANEQAEIIKEFTGDEKWIFEGNMFTLARVDGRLERCDTMFYHRSGRSAPSGASHPLIQHF